MTPLVCIMRNSVCYRGTTKAKPVGILWHDTGAGNTEIRRYVQPDPDDPNRAELLRLIGKNANGNDWNHPNADAKGVNAFIGELADGTVATVQTLPWDYRPWGCGSGPNGSCNGTTGGKMWIQFEICDDGYRDRAYFKKAYAEAVAFTAYLCDKFDLDPAGTVQYNGVTVPVILCHADSYRLGLGSGHGDVLDWFKKMGSEYTMAKVRKDVAEKLKEMREPDMTEKQTQAMIDKAFKDYTPPAPSKAQVLKALGDKWIEVFHDLPAWAKPEVMELIELGALKGTKPAENPEEIVIKMTLSAIRCCIVSLRLAKTLVGEAPREALISELEKLLEQLRGTD